MPNFEPFCRCPGCGTCRGHDAHEQRRRDLPKARALLHSLWGKAKDGPDYDKGQWMELQAIINKGMTGPA